MAKQTNISPMGLAAQWKWWIYKYAHAHPAAREANVVTSVAIGPDAVQTIAVGAIIAQTNAVGSNEAQTVAVQSDALLA